MLSMFRRRVSGVLRLVGEEPVFLPYLRAGALLSWCLGFRIVPASLPDVGPFRLVQGAVVTLDIRCRYSPEVAAGASCRPLSTPSVIPPVRPKTSSPCYTGSASGGYPHRAEVSPHPQFHQDQRSASLTSAGIGYQHVPGLGGLLPPVKNLSNTGWHNTSFRGYVEYIYTPAVGGSIPSAPTEYFPGRTGQLP